MSGFSFTLKGSTVPGLSCPHRQADGDRRTLGSYLNLVQVFVTKTEEVHLPSLRSPQNIFNLPSGLISSSLKYVCVAGLEKGAGSFLRIWWDSLLTWFYNSNCVLTSTVRPFSGTQNITSIWDWQVFLTSPSCLLPLLFLFHIHSIPGCCPWLVCPSGPY